MYRASEERLAPILMTALSTGLGLLPLAISGGQPGSEIQTPLAIVVVCGLLSSTFLNMAVVPALFLRWASATPPQPHDHRASVEEGPRFEGLHPAHRELAGMHVNQGARPRQSSQPVVTVGNQP